jgi:hypothetical protein
LEFLYPLPTIYHTSRANSAEGEQGINQSRRRKTGL